LTDGKNYIGENRVMDFDKELYRIYKKSALLSI